MSLYDADETALHEQMVRDAHDLLPASIAASIPALYATEGDSDPMVWVKLFTPDSQWTWLITEYRPDERLCFGLVSGLDTELGYFALDELEAARGPWGLAVERDLFFQSAPLSVVREREHL